MIYVEVRKERNDFAVLQNNVPIKEMNPETDSVRFYFLGNRYKSKVEHYGVERDIQVDEPLIF